MRMILKINAVPSLECFFLEEKLFQNFPIDLEVTIKNLMQQIIAVNSPNTVDHSVFYCIKLLK